MRYGRRGKNGGEQPQVTPSTPKAGESKTTPFGQRLTCTIDESMRGDRLGMHEAYELMGAGHLVTTTSQSFDPVALTR